MQDFLIVFVGAAAITALVLFLVNTCGGKRGPKPVDTPKRPKLPYRFMTKEELAQFKGSENPNDPILVCIKGNIYDVTPRRDIYGPSCAYNMFAGIDCSRALAKSSFEKADLENSDISDLSFMEQDTLTQWEMSFQMKYDAVGQLVANEAEKQAKTKEYEAKKAAKADAPKQD